MIEERKSQEFISKNIDETINYCIGEEILNGLMSKKHKKVCIVLNYIEHSRILVSVVTWCFNFNFLNWYSYRHFEFCSRINNLRSKCRD